MLGMTEDRRGQLRSIDLNALVPCTKLSESMGGDAMEWGCENRGKRVSALIAAACP